MARVVREPPNLHERVRDAPAKHAASPPCADVVNSTMTCIVILPEQTASTGGGELPSRSPTTRPGSGLFSIPARFRVASRRGTR